MLFIYMLFHCVIFSLVGTKIQILVQTKKCHICDQVNSPGSGTSLNHSMCKIENYASLTKTKNQYELCWLMSQLQISSRLIMLTAHPLLLAFKIHVLVSSIGLIRRWLPLLIYLGWHRGQPSCSDTKCSCVDYRDLDLIKMDDKKPNSAMHIAMETDLEAEGDKELMLRWRSVVMMKRRFQGQRLKIWSSDSKGAVFRKWGWSSLGSPW